MHMGRAWDVDLMQAFGSAMATEQRGQGNNVMLGPGVCLARVPVGGRNFEYLGEDPVLASALTEAEIIGIQREGVIACAKHFVDNNAEGPGHNGRLSTSSVVGERAQHELYYKPFEGAVSAAVGSIMCSCTLPRRNCLLRFCRDAVPPSFFFSQPPRGTHSLDCQ